jgi:hypothetical protein
MLMSIQFKNLKAAQEEAIKNLQIKDNGPANPGSLKILKLQLQAAKDKLPPNYRDAVYEPFMKLVNELSNSDFIKISDPNSSLGFAMFDIAQALIQVGSGYQKDATDAFEEVVSDLYDGFLSAEDRHNIKLPDYNVLPPLVKWGNPDFGPYTLTSDTTASFNINCAIVNLTPSNAKGCLVGWGCLAHETAGHDISHADEGLLKEMAKAIKVSIKNDTKIKNKRIRNTLATYWSERIDETASDIMGILNMGPAAAVTIIPYFRSIFGAFGNPPILRSTGPAKDEHPADILRVMLGSSAVQLLSFSDNKNWAGAILEEGLKDLTTIVLNKSSKIDQASAQRSADIIARVLMQTEFKALDGHSLQEIQDWSDDDEKIVAGLRKALKKSVALNAQIMEGAYAAHVVAASIYEALLVKQDIAPLFDKMIKLLKKMHNNNPGWGPLYIMHPGDLERNFLINNLKRKIKKR